MLDTFDCVTTTVHYPAGNQSWQGVAGKNYSGTLTWKAECIPDHTMGQWELIKPPTQELLGEEKRICQYCDHFEVRDVARLPVSVEDPTEPTITEPIKPTEPEGTESVGQEMIRPTEQSLRQEKQPTSNRTWLIVVIIAASVLAAGGAAVSVVLVKKRS
jgi:hypothetical protein